MINIEIRLIIFFAAKIEKLYTVSKTKWGANSGSDMNSLLPNSDLIKESRENH